MPKVEVRTMLPGDGSVLRAVRLRALEESPSAFESSLAIERELGDAHWERYAATPGNVTFFAERDGAVVGTAGGCLHRGDPSSASLVAMWVAPEARRTGAGRALIHTVTAWARHHDARSLGLCVVEDNAPALAFYEAVGFAATGEHRVMKGIREAVMRRSI